MNWSPMRLQASRGWRSACASEVIPEVRGYGVMSAYCGEPAETAQAIDTDGFLRTMGRYKHMLQVGGECRPDRGRSLSRMPP